MNGRCDDLIYILSYECEPPLPVMFSFNLSPDRFITI